MFRLDLPSCVSSGDSAASPFHLLVSFAAVSPVAAQEWQFSRFHFLLNFLIFSAEKVFFFIVGRKIGYIYK